jgi:peroxiredoxin Q/BCP
MVSLDHSEKNAAFAESLDGNFPLLSDPEKDAARAYGVLGVGSLYAKRWTFYIDREGMIRKIDKKVKPSSAGQDMVKQIEALGLSG